ncbi:MAG: DUF3147 family protein [Gammaproteobacteria bacterium]|nr:DUF3147 family protein [Gammaproteobacteria bacterium]
MLYFAVKVLLTSVLVVLVAEAGRRSALLGAVFASLPLVSVLGMIWLYVDTRDPERIAALSTSIFWLVLPSLALFLVLPVLLRHGWPFFVSLLLGIALTAAAYAAMLVVLRRAGVSA